MQNHKKRRSVKNNSLKVDVVCFGMIVPALTFVVNKFPSHNTGAVIQRVAEFISDDAAIVATLLRGFGIRSGLIGSALGDDARGRAAIRKLKQDGVRGAFRLTRSFPTPHEVNISDRTGHRTFFWQRDPHVLATLDSASLSMLDHAKMLYVDWYDGDHIIRPMQQAVWLGIPVFLNLEHAHEFPHALAYARHANIVQANTNAAQSGGDALYIARKILKQGVQVVLMTLAGKGCIAVTNKETLRARAPQVNIIDGCGAGAAFSAGFIFAHSRRWSLERALRFAIAAGSSKCTRIGLGALPLDAVTRLSRRIDIRPHS